MNDPFEGGMHLPDIFLFKPIYQDGQRLAFAATICHHTDVGGRVAGSNASDSTEIYQEGLRIPPLKLYDAGRRNETLFDADREERPGAGQGVRRSARPARRLPHRRAPVPRARRALWRRWRPRADGGRDRPRRAPDRAAALAELPDGQWSFEDWIDDDGVDLEQPIRLFVTMTKRGDQMLVDWTGTDPQVKGAINNTYSYTKAASYTAIRSVLPANIPNNEGVFRAIEVIAPPGTIANGVLPAACAARGLTGFRMVDCAFGCLAMMLPDRVFAASDGGNTGISIGGYDADRTPFIYVDFTCGAWGARPWADGLDGNSNMFANMASHSVEVTEAEQPIRIEAYEFVPDKAGPGKIPGRRAVPARLPISRAGGRPPGALRPPAASGPTASTAAARAGRRGTGSIPRPRTEPLPSKLTMTIRKGEVFRHELAGAGGWGDPLERDLERGRARCRPTSLSSPEAARADYGVVIAAGAARRGGDARGCATSCAAPAAGASLRKCCASKSL